MSQFSLYREPAVLDTVKHRQLKMGPTTDMSVAAGMHASYLAVTEFPMAAREYVIVFVRDQAQGKLQAQPAAVLGTTVGENLFVTGTTWDARYVPAYVRRYPFWTAQFEGQAAPAVVIDAGWRGFSQTEGDPLYDADGRPAPRLVEALGFIDTFEVEAARTQAFCAQVVALDLLREMTASVTLPDGSELAMDGFFVVDEARLMALPDAVVLEMHRSGMLGLLHAHLMSLWNLQALAERKIARQAG